MLLLGCSDARHALFTLWTYGSECNRERRRWHRLAAEERIKLQQQRRQREGSVDDSLRTLRFTLNDREPACLARVLLLLQLFFNSSRELVRDGMLAMGGVVVMGKGEGGGAESETVCGVRDGVPLPPSKTDE